MKKKKSKKKTDRRKITITFSGEHPDEIAKMKISGFGPGKACILTKLRGPSVSVRPDFRVISNYDGMEHIATNPRLTISIEGDMF
jgi:hypothetical protein